MSPTPPIVGFIEQFEGPSPEELASAARAEARPARLTIRGNKTFLVDTSHPYFPAWYLLLSRRSASNRPVYLETNADGEWLTRIEIPRRHRIANIYGFAAFRGFEIRSASSPMPMFLSPDRLRFLDLLDASRREDREILITLDPDTHEILHVRLPFSTPESKEPDGPIGKGLLPALDSLEEVLTINQAIDEFEFLASRPYIPFDYPDNCCNARAHEMFRLLALRGFRCRKIWNYAGIGSSLTFYTLHNKEGFVRWGYHVAPIVKVRLRDSAVVEMVMDPAMFCHPARVPDWVALQHDSTAFQKTDEPEIFERPLTGSSSRDNTFFKTCDGLDDCLDYLNDRKVKSDLGLSLGL